MPQLTYIGRLIVTQCRRSVVGVTSVNNDRLFVLRSPSSQQIEVYEKATFKPLPELNVSGLGDSEYNSLTACVITNCLFASDYYQSSVYRVPMSDDCKISKWRVGEIGEGPTGLSINAVGNILVTCHDGNELFEYTTSGSRVRKISLQLNNEWLSPYHAIQLTDDRYAVCLSEPGDNSTSDDVVEINCQGRVITSYKEQLQSTTRRHFSSPHYLATDKNKERIFVADFNNDRIVILRRSLKRALEMVVSIDGKQPRSPRCILFDNSLLYVGEGVDDGRIFVYDVRCH